MIDPLAGFNPKAETTLFLMREAALRGIEIWAFTLPDITYDTGEVYGQGQRLQILGANQSPFYRILEQKRIRLRDQNALFLRKDPPFDLTYLHHLYLLSEIRGKVFMMNDPLGILRVSEKIYSLKFSHFSPKSCITQNFEEAQAFARRQKRGIVLKPLFSSGGRGVFYLKPGDTNFSVAFEALSEEGRQYVLCQEYLKEAERGDKRIMILNGEILGYFLRVARKGEHRANLHSGGILKKCRLTLQERERALRVGQRLKSEGLSLVGLDFIGEKLTEINVTSPMGLNEINWAMGGHSEKKVIDFVEERARISEG